MLGKKYRKVSEPNAGHAYHVQGHGRSGHVHQWLLCRESDLLDRHLVTEQDLGNPSLWMHLE